MTHGGAKRKRDRIIRKKASGALHSPKPIVHDMLAWPSRLMRLEVGFFLLVWEEVEASDALGSLGSVCVCMTVLEEARRLGGEESYR